MSDILLSPLENVISLDLIRSDIAEIIAPLLGRLAYNDSEFIGTSEGGKYWLSVKVLDELVLNLPFVEGLALVLGSGDVDLDIIMQLVPSAGGQVVDDEDVYPEDLQLLNGYIFDVAIAAELLKLRIPRTWLVPAVSDGHGGYVADPDTTHCVDITIPLGLKVNEKLHVEVLFPGDELGVSLPPCFIGETGVFLQADDIKLDLNRSSSIDEITAAGYGPDFVGIYIGEATAMFPNSWQADPDHPTSAVLKAQELIIGTGGVSGTISMSATNAGDLLHYKLDDFQIALDSCSITFDHSSITDSNIHGLLTIPGFSGGPVGVDIHPFGGEFSITVCSDNGPVISVPDVFSFKLKCLTMGARGGRFFAGVSGKLSFDLLQGPLGNFLPRGIDIEKMVIWSNGEFEFDGGGFVLPKAVSLSVGPVELSVSAVHIGSVDQLLGKVQRHYKYFGFDGGVKTGIGGVDARGKGVKFYFTTDDDPAHGKPHHFFMRIESLEIDITLPGNVSEDEAAVIIKGWISMKNTNDQGSEAARSLTEYAGGVDLKLPSLDIEGGANMRITPDNGAFLVDADLELSTPILVGTTGLGIYGFRGTIGNKYVLSKHAAHVSDNAPWWEFYKAPKVGINVDKFDQKSGFSFGAGVTLATAADAGYTFSARIFFMLSLPKVFLLEGQAAILSKRLGFDTPGDPPFYAAIIISDESIEAGFGVHLKVPNSGTFEGQILDLHASLEMAFYWRQASAWHFWAGQDQPPEKRISAVLFNIFNSYAYLMISGSGVKAGAGVEWHVEKSFGGIAKVGLGASLDVGGSLSFRPVQIGGYIRLSGYAELKVFGIGFRLDVGATLGAEAPDPFVIHGSFTLKIKTPWPLPDVNISASLTWNINSHIDRSPVGLIDAGAYTGDTAAARLQAYMRDGRHPAKALHMVTQQPLMLNYVNTDNPAGSAIPAPTAVGTDGAWNNLWVGDFATFTLPLDSYIDIDFIKGIKPDSTSASIQLLGPITTSGEYSENIPPQRGHSDQVEHKYIVKNVYVKYHNNSGWQDYLMWQANTPLLDDAARDAIRNGTTSTPQQLETLVHDNVKYGFWQMTQAGKYSKLRLLARTPLSQSVNLRPADAGFPKVILLCPEDPLPMECLNWSKIAMPHTYGGNSVLFDRKLSYRIVDQSATVVDTDGISIFGLKQAMMLAHGNTIEIFLPKATTKLHLKLATFGDQVTISYYRGYPYTPGASGSSGGGGGAVLNAEGVLVTQWDIAPVTSVRAAAGNSVWSKLRGFGAIARTICTATPNAADVAALDALLGKFANTDYYLRQYNWMTDPELLEPAGGHDFCWRLRETLRTLITALTGKDGFPEYLNEYLEHFYQDLSSLTDDYRKRTAGASVTNPPAAANLFYEKWMDLLGCIGEIFDRQPLLPGHLSRLRESIIDPYLDDLYRTVRDHIVTHTMELNQWPDLTNPYDQLRYVAAAFAWLSVDLSGITTPMINYAEPYFGLLEECYITMKRAIAEARETVCTTASCWTNKDIIDIARLLCKTPPATPLTTTLAAIQSLVVASETDLVAIAAYLGVTLADAPGTFCGKLRRALGVLIAACAMIDELPFAQRYPLVNFYTALQALVDQYKNEQKGKPKVAAQGVDLYLDADHFIDDWSEMVTCLCNLCTLRLSDPDEAQVASTLDPQLAPVFAAVADRARNEGVPVYGYHASTDLAAQVHALDTFFQLAAFDCNTGIGAVVAGLATDFTALNTAYTAGGGLQATLAAAGYLFCGPQPQPMQNPCHDWVEMIEFINQLCERSTELGASVMAQFDTDATAAVLFQVYGILVALPPIEFTSRLQEITWFTQQIRPVLLRTCLANGTLSAIVQAGLAAQVQAMQDVIEAIIPALDEAGINFVSDVGQDGLANDYPYWISVLRESARILCWQAPNTALAPITAIIALVNGSGELFERLADELDAPAPAGTMTSQNFCAYLNQALGIITLGYGNPGRLSVKTLAELKTFYAAFAVQTANYLALAGAPGAGTTCSQSSDAWLDVLRCIGEACRYRSILSPAIVSALDALGTTIGPIYNKVLGIALARGMQIAPRQRAGDRCRMLRAVRTYVATGCLDYDFVTTTLIPMFTDVHANPDLTGFKTAYTALKTSVAAMCPVRQDGPYDPLRKRETKLRGELLREVVYENDEEPIDRILIETSTTCDPNQQGSWQATYWGQVNSYMSGTLIPQLLTEYQQAVTAVTTEELADRESAAAYDARDRRDQAHDEWERATTFLGATKPLKAALLPCSTLVYEICWQPPAVFDYNLNLPDPHETRKGAQNLVVSLKSLTQPIWRPNTTYAVQIETREEISGADPVQRFYTFGFSTAGPVGHFHQTGTGAAMTTRDDYHALQLANKEDTYPYSTLRQYIDYKRSYPRADGDLINAKPLYYTMPKITLYYEQNYVESMYSRWRGYTGLPYIHSDLEIVLKDPAKDAASNSIELGRAWQKDPKPRLAKDVLMFNRIMSNTPVRGKNCVQFTPIQPGEPPAARVVTEPVTLEPAKLYTAVFNAAFGELAYDPEGTPNSDPAHDPAVARREVHKYVFQTSRYADFAGHIGSYRMQQAGQPEKLAIFSRTLDDPAADTTAAANILNGHDDQVPDTLRRDFADRFDRLVSGALKLSGLEPPETLEFNKVKDSNGAIIGILVRSPEPLNDPQMPPDAIEQTVTVVSGLTGPIVLWSKDRSSVFISNAAVSIASGTSVLIRFEYWEFNGETYARGQRVLPPDAPPGTNPEISPVDVGFNVT